MLGVRVVHLGQMTKTKKEINAQGNHKIPLIDGGLLSAVIPIFYQEDQVHAEQIV